MSTLTPIYTSDNCKLAYQLNWSLTLFWRHTPNTADWLAPLQSATEPDGVRVLKHRFSSPQHSLLFVSTQPHVSAMASVRSVKGRLQYLIRDRWPKAFQCNYALRSIGSTRRAKLDRYLAIQ